MFLCQDRPLVASRVVALLSQMVAKDTGDLTPLMRFIIRLCSLSGTISDPRSCQDPVSEADGGGR